MWDRIKELENVIRLLNREIWNLKELNRGMSKCVDETLKDYKLQIKENIKLKKKLENSVWFWKKKVAKLSEENRQLKHRNEILDLSLKASVHPLVYNELVWNIEISK